MELAFIWCEARAAQERLRNTFKESSKLDKELTLNSRNEAGTRAPHCYVLVKERPTAARVRNQRLGRVTANSRKSDKADETKGRMNMPTRHNTEGYSERERT